jgi:phosphatidylinositol alpha-mannosyltransferase
VRRIGLVCPYSLDVPGGVQNHVLGLAGALSAAGHEVSVLAPGEAPGDHDADHVVSLGRTVPLRYKGSVGRVAFGPATATRVARWLDAGDFDVLHVHEPLTPSASLLAVRAADVPVVATFHTAQDRPRVLATSAGLLRPWLGRIDAHIAVSDTAARTVRRYLPVQPQVIPNGLDVGGYDGPRRRDGRTMLFLGRTDEPRKGLHTLLSAWPGIRARVPEARLLVAGPGRGGPASRDLPAGVELLGQLDEADKRCVLRNADLLVAPNTHGESFGLVLVEAMAAGTPVLARDLPAFRDVLGGGRYGDLYDSDLVERAAFLLNHPSYRERAAAEARGAAQRYDWSQVVPEVLEVYAGLADAEAAAS